MSKCEHLAGCPFFNDKMKEIPVIAQMYKNKYCLGDGKMSCARYKVREALGPSEVPIDLFPNQNDRANALISSKGH